MFGHKPLSVPDPADALPGRPDAMAVPAAHFVNGRPLVGPFADGIETVVVGMGCFWGAERMFWDTPGVWTTAVGYAGGHTPNPTYEEVCAGYTGHNEVVLVAWETTAIDLTSVLRVFWENHNPTQGMRQGNDAGTQYRSGLYYYDDKQKNLVLASRDAYQKKLTAAGFGEITTEICEVPEYYFAEEYHQQYLDLILLCCRLYY